jgi:hypothetical protein
MKGLVWMVMDWDAIGDGKSGEWKVHKLVEIDGIPCDEG